MSQKEELFINHFSYIYDHFIDLYNNFNQEQSKTNAKIAHEIKNPLAIIRSMLQLVEQKVPEVRETPYWESVFNEIDYINILLTKLSLYSRSLQLEKQPLRLEHLLEDIKISFDSYASQQGVQLSVHYPSNLPTLEGDPIKLKQALSNILKNAFEATNTNGQISLYCCQQEDAILIEISDTGEGMDSQQINSIFEPFVTYKASGTGLGLSIVKNIIEEHNGSIEVKSSPDQGTTFSIKLPISLSMHTAI